MDAFIKNSNPQALIDSAKCAACWDFNTALGTTLKQKYESLYIKIVEVSQILIRKGASGYFWIMCSPAISTMFETTTRLKSMQKHEYYPMGTVDKQCIGVLDKRWRVYVDPSMSLEDLIIGCETTEHVGVVHFVNYII